mgnify:FL=1
MTSSHFYSSSWIGPEFCTTKNRWPVNSQNAKGKFLLVNVKNLTYHIYFPGLAILQQHVHLLFPPPSPTFCNLSSFTQRMNSGAAQLSKDRHLPSVLGLPLHPILSGANSDQSVELSPAFLACFHIVPYPDFDHLTLLMSMMTEMRWLILYTWKLSQLIYLSSCFDLSPRQHDEATKIYFVYQYAVKS